MCLCFSTRVLQRRNGKTAERRQKDAAFPLLDGGERQSDGGAGLVLVSWCLRPNVCVQLCPQTGHRENSALRPFLWSLCFIDSSRLTNPVQTGDSLRVWTLWRRGFMLGAATSHRGAQDAPACAVFLLCCLITS